MDIIKIPVELPPTYEDVEADIEASCPEERDLPRFEDLTPEEVKPSGTKVCGFALSRPCIGISLGSPRSSLPFGDPDRKKRISESLVDSCVRRILRWRRRISIRHDRVIKRQCAPHSLGVFRPKYQHHNHIHLILAALWQWLSYHKHLILPGTESRKHSSTHSDLILWNPLDLSNFTVLPIATGGKAPNALLQSYDGKSVFVVHGPGDRTGTIDQISLQGKVLQSYSAPGGIGLVNAAASKDGTRLVAMSQTLDSMVSWTLGSAAAGTVVALSRKHVRIPPFMSTIDGILIYMQDGIPGQSLEIVGTSTMDGQQVASYPGTQAAWPAYSRNEIWIGQSESDAVVSSVDATTGFLSRNVSTPYAVPYDLWSSTNGSVIFVGYRSGFVGAWRRLMDPLSHEDREAVHQVVGSAQDNPDSILYKVPGDAVVRFVQEIVKNVFSACIVHERKCNLRFLKEPNANVLFDIYRMVLQEQLVQEGLEKYSISNTIPPFLKDVVSSYKGGDRQPLQVLKVYELPPQVTKSLSEKDAQQLCERSGLSIEFSILSRVGGSISALVLCNKRGGQKTIIGGRRINTKNSLMTIFDASSLKHSSVQVLFEEVQRCFGMVDSETIEEELASHNAKRWSKTTDPKPQLLAPPKVGLWGKKLGPGGATQLLALTQKSWVQKGFGSEVGSQLRWARSWVQEVKPIYAGPVPRMVKPIYAGASDKKLGHNYVGQEVGLWIQKPSSSERDPETIERVLDNPPSARGEANHDVDTEIGTDFNDHLTTNLTFESNRKSGLPGRVEISVFWVAQTQRSWLQEVQPNLVGSGLWERTWAQETQQSWVQKIVESSVLVSETEQAAKSGKLDFGSGSVFWIFGSRVVESDKEGAKGTSLSPENHILHNIFPDRISSAVQKSMGRVCNQQVSTIDNGIVESKTLRSVNEKGEMSGMDVPGKDPPVPWWRRFLGSMVLILHAIILHAIILHAIILHAIHLWTVLNLDRPDITRILRAGEMTINIEQQAVIKIPEDVSLESRMGFLHALALECGRKGLLSDLSKLDYTQNRGKQVETPLVLSGAHCQTVVCVALVPASTMPIRSTKLTLENLIREFLTPRNLDVRKRIRIMHSFKTTFVCGKNAAKAQATSSQWERDAIKEVENMLYLTKDISDRYRMTNPHERDRRIGFVSFAIHVSDLSISAIQALAHDKAWADTNMFDMSGHSQRFSAVPNNNALQKIEETPVGIDIESLMNHTFPDFQQVVDRGMMRIKVTECVSGLKSVDVHDLVDLATSFFEYLSAKANLFEHPIASQWKNIGSMLRGSVGIVDWDTRDYIVAFWCNSTIGKVLLSRRIAHTPPHDSSCIGLIRTFAYVQSRLDGQKRRNDNVPRSSEHEGLTYTSVGRDPLDPQARGLINLDVCGLVVPTTHQQFKGKYAINYQRIQVKYPHFSAMRTDGPVMEPDESAIGAKYWNITNQRSIVDGKFHASLTELADSAKVQVFAFRQLAPDGSSHVLLTEGGKLYRSSKEITAYIRETGRHFKRYNNVWFWGPEICPLFSFVKVRKYSSSRNNTICVEVSNIQLHPALSVGSDGIMRYNENVDMGDLADKVDKMRLEESSLSMDAIPNEITWTSSIPCIGEIKMGSYLITAIRETYFRSQTSRRFFMVINGKIHKSSFVFDDVLNSTAPDYNALGGRMLFQIYILEADPGPRTRRSRAKGGTQLLALTQRGWVQEVELWVQKVLGRAKTQSTDTLPFKSELITKQTKSQWELASISGLSMLGLWILNLATQLHLCQEGLETQEEHLDVNVMASNFTVGIDSLFLKHDLIGWLDPRILEV
ncbi:hypothetical protein BDK51DRAFT_29583 [Blyttiomyces helicus]|uniref:Uncharacterized protein n=1 Tax=Blyttiomyces helicus TaxID=388810 RepID=A0A4P9WSE7_9FUNG|nr:hypothetical protein BDK51DRAFT_29583 [Blyttiomyces helicus]|eukprot:RKO93926.1 hypothetical protein BDK51DRAFT_29583 [Blyttiomyces helicus]